MNDTNISIRKNICMFLNKWLKDNAVTDIAFADAIGVSAASVRRWRIGDCIPDIDLFPKVCNYMNVSILDFMGLDDITCLSERQSQLLSKYQNEETFRNLVDRYRDNNEFKIALDTFIKLMK